MEFDYYHMETGDKFEEYFKFVRQVAMEDYELCEKAQGNLEKGIYAEGILNPVKETGVACESLRQTPISCNNDASDYQQRVLDLVCAQHETEMEAKPSDAHGGNGDLITVASQLVDTSC